MNNFQMKLGEMWPDSFISFWSWIGRNFIAFFLSFMLTCSQQMFQNALSKKVRVKRKLLWIFKAIIWQRFWEFIFWFSGHGNGQRSFSFTLCAQKSANQACDSFCSAFLKMQENRKIVQRSFFMSISNQKI